MSPMLFSSRHRPPHEGPYPTDILPRQSQIPDLAAMAPMTALRFDRPEAPQSLVNAMGEYQAMLDAIRDGLVNRARADIPDDPEERARHLKAFGYFCDASMVGICTLPDAARMSTPITNPAIARLAEDLRTRQTRTLASGIDVIMADLRESMDAPPTSIDAHTHALVLLYASPRAPMADEAGSDWLDQALAQRSALRANETAVVLANYIRLLGFDARAHSASAGDVDLERLAVAAGLIWPDRDAPFIGRGYGLAAVTATMALASDRALALRTRAASLHPRWLSGRGQRFSRFNHDAFAQRRYVDGPWPFERLTRVDTPTTYIDEANVPRVPKRTDLFARAQFGDLGPRVQANARGGHYARKSAVSFAQRRALGAFVLLQDGEHADGPRPDDAARNAANVKAAAYFLGADAVGLSRCPDWAWYSHDATGEPIVPTHDQAISIIIDQGYETMDGASGDDWISVAQSMRAYLRFSLIGGVLAKQIRNLGYRAKAHTVLDGDVLQPPLLLLSGLGEVSRIGEVILNPYLGPRLKSGVVTTDMPLTHDRPVDFGLQAFCEQCNKCARECPSGAITAGPKRMFNGYEIWKSDSQKCATYRITTDGGAMCGRCMKTCPWNLEGLFAEAPFRWMASHVPALAKPLARLDDALGRGGLNPVKKWWWDIELYEDGAYRPARAPMNARDLQTGLAVRYEDQTLAVYPANLAPPPWPYPSPMDREAGVRAYRALLSASDYRDKLARGDTDHLHRYRIPGDAPVVQVVVDTVVPLTSDVTAYTLRRPDGGELPAWTAGAHIDVVVAPEYLRAFSLYGDPAERSAYRIAVQREEDGRGGSVLMHRIFAPGRRVFVSRPVNQFALQEDAASTILFGGGIGITPLIAFAHRLHALDRVFELHYSAHSADEAAFDDVLSEVPWADAVTRHYTAMGGRADFRALLPDYHAATHVYLCGSDGFMQAATAAARQRGYPPEAIHLEYFSLPDTDESACHAFTLRLDDGREFHVPADRSATDVLADAGVPVDVKCSDGLCGVCQCRVVSGDVLHRDAVLTEAQRQHAMILCRSRARHPDGVIEIALGCD